MIKKIWVEGEPLDIINSLNGLAEELRLAHAKIVELENRLKLVEAQQPTELQRLRRRTNAQ